MSQPNNRRKWEYTLEDIAAAAGVSVHTVRDHKEKKWLDPGDLMQVGRYIVGNRMKPQAAPKRVVGEYDATWGDGDETSGGLNGY